MRTKILNVFEEQRKWQLWHLAAHATFQHDGRTGRVMQATYDAPIKKWEWAMGPDGTVLVPDMDYYNTLTNESDIRNAIEEIFGEGNIGNPGRD